MGITKTREISKTKDGADAAIISDESVDSFELEVARVDKDYSERILEEDLTLNQMFSKGIGNAESHRLNKSEEGDANEVD